MKILFTRFPLESAMNGGAELQTISLMQGLMERGHAVAFAGSCKALIAMCRERNIPTVEWEIGPPPVTKKNAVTFAWRRLSMKKRLEELLMQFHRLDAVVMLSMSEKLLLTDVAAGNGTKVFWIEHDRVGPWLAKSPWLSLLLRCSMQAMTIVVSELSRKIYLCLGWEHERVVAIPNGVDEARLQPHERVAASGERGALRIVCIARLSHEKGVDVLLRAVARVPDVTLEIIGGGREEGKLHALAESLHIADRITFTPQEQEIAKAYARMDALVLPSRNHDPFGMVAAEAMMLGIPVIVTDQCGIATYLENGKDAIIVKADSVDELTDAIVSYRKPDVRNRTAKEGQKTAKETFTLHTMIERYAALMEN